MKKIIWNIEQTIAIPIENIKSYEIAVYPKNNGINIFKVIAHYTILSGLTETVYEAEDKGSCIEFINHIYKEA